MNILISKTCALYNYNNKINIKSIDYGDGALSPMPVRCDFGVNGP